MLDNRVAEIEKEILDALQLKGDIEEKLFAVEK